MTDPVRWFDTLGECACGKPAVGVLRGHNNESYGNYCRRCAEKRLASAEHERQNEEAERERQQEYRARKVATATAPPPTATDINRVAWSVRDWAEAVGCSKITVHRLIKTDTIKTKLMGRKRLILVSPEEYVDGLEAHGTIDRRTVRL